MAFVLTNLGADEAQIDKAFREATTTAKQQKSISLIKRAEATYAEFRRRKGERDEYGFPLSP